MDLPEISLLLAFLAGIVSFLSPCVLPVVPAYIVFISGVTMEELGSQGASRARRKALFHSIYFSIGFLAVFMTLGASATVFGQAFNRLLPEISRLGGLIIIGFGLFLLGWIRLPSLAKDMRFQLKVQPSSYIGTLGAGIIFGAGWTPCIGPLLGTILLYVTMGFSVAKGVLLLALYGLGLALPFIAVTVTFHWFTTSLRWVQLWAHRLQQIAGLCLVLLGFLLFSGTFASMSASLADLGQMIDLEMP